MERTIKTLTVILSKDDGNVAVTFYDPGTGNSSKIIAPYSPDEHQEFNDMVGDHLYWWINECVAHRKEG